MVRKWKEKGVFMVGYGPSLFFVITMEKKGRKRPSKDEDKLRYESKKNPSGLFIMRVYECDEVALDHMHV